MQIYISDYIQHYGLRRAQKDDGSYVAVGHAHSWNAPHAYSGAMMVHAARHSDHHVSPSKPYSTLEVDKESMPLLPHSLPVMGLLALFPSRWRRVMDPLCVPWQSDPTP